MCVPEVVISGGWLVLGRSVWMVGKALPALDTIASAPHLLDLIPSTFFALENCKLECKRKKDQSCILMRSNEYSTFIEGGG